MKKFVFTIIGMIWVMGMKAQPRPFEPDPSFVPTLDYMQKSWSGEYDGLEPNSKMILSLSRTLVLKADFTYLNEVRGQIKGQSEEVLLRYEKGIYQYNVDNHTVIYCIDVDSTLDINILLKGEELSYVVNHYSEEGTAKTSTDEVQFTRAANDEARQWIFFDSQLMSPIDPRQKAVYVMIGKKMNPLGISGPSVNKRYNNRYFTLDGREKENPQKGFYIINRKKILIK